MPRGECTEEIIAKSDRICPHLQWDHSNAIELLRM